MWRAIKSAALASLAKAWASASPMPELAPVMTTKDSAILAPSSRRRHGRKPAPDIVDDQPPTSHHRRVEHDRPRRRGGRQALDDGHRGAAAARLPDAMTAEIDLLDSQRIPRQGPVPGAQA